MFSCYKYYLLLTLQVVIVLWVIYDMSSDDKKYKFFAKKFELYFFPSKKKEKWKVWVSKQCILCGKYRYINTFRIQNKSAKSIKKAHNGFSVP